MAPRTALRALFVALQLWLAIGVAVPSLFAGAALAAPVQVRGEQEDEEREESAEVQGWVQRSAALPRRRIFWAPWAPESDHLDRARRDLRLDARRMALPTPDLSRQQEARLPRRIDPPECV